MEEHNKQLEQEEKYFADPIFIIQYDVIQGDEELYKWDIDAHIKRSAGVEAMNGVCLRVQVDALTDIRYVLEMLSNVKDKIRENTHLDEMIEHNKKMSFLIEVKKEIDEGLSGRDDLAGW
jgi:hypothetical protein